jgi:HAMP domain-containing protein
VKLQSGWFDRVLLGESRVGVAFELGPLGWTVAVTELEAIYFSDIWNIQLAYFWILNVAVVVAIVLLSIFIHHIIRPVELLAGTIGRITATGDLDVRAEVEVADEIGILAGGFNTMVSTLEANYKKLEAMSEAEKQARRTAVEREETTLDILARVSEFRDEETGQHLKRIGTLSALFFRLLGQSAEQQELILHSAPLHDIGKIGIPDSILLKKSRLSPDEIELVKRHSLLGNDLLRNARSIYLIEGAKIALTHHEKWDGTGYPAGLAGEEIPLSGRIVSIVDVFDALTSVRPYKEAWSIERALEYIAGQRGKHFDPHLVDLFLENFSDFRRCLSNIDLDIGFQSDQSKT